jgi:uncharacterized protein YggT (Ycf19 family)
MATTYLVPRSSRGDLAVRAVRVIDYLFGILYALLAIRLILDLVRARPGAGFVQFIDRLTAPFYGPFQGIVANGTIDGTHPIVWPLVIAIVAYLVLQALIHGLFRLALRA